MPAPGRDAVIASATKRDSGFAGAHERFATIARAARTSATIAFESRGATNHAISADLVITERAVEAHVNSVFAKLNLFRTPETTERGGRAAYL